MSEDEKAAPAWIAVSEYAYNDALECLPPAAMTRGWFLVGEPHSHVEDGPTFACYREVKGDGGTEWFTWSEPVTQKAFRAMVAENAPIPDDVPSLPDVKARALAQHFEVSADGVSECRCGENLYECESEPGKYWVLTDEEADDAWDQALQTYLDDCVLSELPDIAKRYFDEEAWKADARHDGRAHSLGGYDGNEYEVKIDGQTFYIYRVT